MNNTPTPPKDMAALREEIKQIRNRNQSLNIMLDSKTFDTIMAAFTAYHAAAVAEAELLAEKYGRLHETIELFQLGVLSADEYSNRHNVLTNETAALRRQQDGENMK